MRYQMVCCVGVFCLMGFVAVDLSAQSGGSLAVKTVRPKRASVERQLTLAGWVKASEEATVRARATGYVARCLVDVGSSVEKGDVLLEIDVPEMRVRSRLLESRLMAAKTGVAIAKARTDEAVSAVRAAEAQVTAADARLRAEETAVRFSKIEHNRFVELAKDGSVTPQQVEQKERALQEAVARLASAEANRVVRQAGVQSAQSTVARAKQEIAAANHSVKEAEANVAAHAVRLAFARVTAAFKGTVVQRFVDTGAYIAGGDGSSQPTVLFRLIRSGGVRVVFPIPEREVPFIRKGANVVISGAGVSGAPITSKISLVPAALTDSNRTLSVQALSNDPRLVPGMGIRGQIHMETHSGVVTVPSASLHFNKKKAHVLCIRDGAVVKVGVVVGFNDLIRAEVKGVAETDDVIFESRSKVKVGDRVHSSEGDGR